MPQDAPPNGGAAPDGPKGPYRRVAKMQAKLHRWRRPTPAAGSTTCSTFTDMEWQTPLTRSGRTH